MTAPRQIDWLATPRERYGNRYAEFKLQCAVASTLRQFINPRWRAVHLPFGVLIRHAAGRGVRLPLAAFVDPKVAARLTAAVRTG